VAPVTAQDPKIVARKTWGAVPQVTPAAAIVTPSKELWLHHVGGDEPGAAGMRNLQHEALTGGLHDNYIDIPYSFKVDKDGSVFEARGPGRNSGATADHNTVSHAIVCDGNYATEEPSSAMLASLANLVAWGFEHGWWPLAITGGHCQASGNSTDCPCGLLPHIPDVNGLAARIHAGAPKPVPGPVSTSEEDEMYICVTEGKPTWLVGGGKPIQLNATGTQNFQAAGVKVVRVDPAENDRINAATK
jgi:hypothetical protein